MATHNNIKSEARRRKIQDTGSDRLALITGRIQTLPPSPRTPSETTQLHARNESTPAVFFSQQDHETPRTPFYDHSNAGFNQGSGDATTYKVLRRERSLGYLKGNSYDNANKLETQLHKIRTDRETLRAIIKDDIKSEPLPNKSVVQDTTNLLLAPNKAKQNKIFSSKRIHYCIINSQGTRSICALVIALLVVLSYSKYPLLNIVSSESMIVSRPLHALLLTDIMIVVTLVYLENRWEMEQAEAGKAHSQEDGNNMAEAIVLMERGLVTYQIVRGVFIDFSIYAVVLICGLSLV